MFSFIKKYAEGINGVDVFGDFGLVLFVIVFLGAVLFALKANKNYISELAHLPLNDSSKN
ncbi:MAG: Cytochrome oxidase subunit [Bacteroidota bacterium]|nr:Cytochrome oxidase subunit [Bacteroidota bacterium]